MLLIQLRKNSFLHSRAHADPGAHSAVLLIKTTLAGNLRGMLTSHPCKRVLIGPSQSRCHKIRAASTPPSKKRLGQSLGERKRERWKIEESSACLGFEIRIELYVIRNTETMKRNRSNSLDASSKR